MQSFRAKHFPRAIALAAFTLGLAVMSGPHAPTASAVDPIGYIAIDCDMTAPGTQTSCTQVWPANTNVDVAVVYGNTSDEERIIGAYDLTVRADQTKLQPLPNVDNNYNGNPDPPDPWPPTTGFWSCGPANGPTPDLNGDPAIADSWISCFVSAGGAPVAAGAEFVLARVHYKTLVSTAIDVDALSANVGDWIGVPLASCPPVNTRCGTTPMADISDADGDGLPSPGSDNCPFVTNAAQTNTDGAALVVPGKAYTDSTVPNSDNAGDACDTDADNDGLADLAETGGAPCASATAATDPVKRDTDGDKVLDGAECELNTDPATFNAMFGSPQQDGDSDGDGVRNSVEVRYYNTDPNNANTDGDACNDGKEIASINADTAVNATDLSQTAQSFGDEITLGSPYSAALDPNKDGRINAIDLGFVAQRFGNCAPTSTGPDISIAISRSSAFLPYDPGAVSYGLTLTNTGTAVATDVVTEMAVPPFHHLISSSCAEIDNRVYCNASDLGPGETRVLGLTFGGPPTDPPVGSNIRVPVRAQASASNEPSDRTGDNSAATSINVNP